MREGGNHPARHHRPVVRRDGGQQVAGDEKHQQDGQHGLALEAGHRGGESQRSHHDGEGIAGDEPAGGGFAHLEVCGHFGEQPHDDEFGESDAEPAEG